MATSTNLCTKRGDTWQVTFTWSQESDGAPIDLTGCTARLQARKPVAATRALTRSAIAAQLDYEAPVIDVSSATGEITFTELEGKVHVRVESAEMDILPGSYDLDLELTFPDGTVKSTATQVLEIVEDVTYV